MADVDVVSSQEDPVQTASQVAATVAAPARLVGRSRKPATKAKAKWKGRTAGATADTPAEEPKPCYVCDTGFEEGERVVLKAMFPCRFGTRLRCLFMIC